jgi:hypothetical protein
MRGSRWIELGLLVCCALLPGCVADQKHSGPTVAPTLEDGLPKHREKPVYDYSEDTRYQALALRRAQIIETFRKHDYFTRNQSAKFLLVEVVSIGLGVSGTLGRDESPKAMRLSGPWNLAVVLTSAENERVKKSLRKLPRTVMASSPEWGKLEQVVRCLKESHISKAAHDEYANLPDGWKDPWSPGVDSARCTVFISVYDQTGSEAYTFENAVFQMDALQGMEVDNARIVDRSLPCLRTFLELLMDGDGLAKGGLANELAHEEIIEELWVPIEWRQLREGIKQR